MFQSKKVSIRVHQFSQKCHNNFHQISFWIFSQISIYCKFQMTKIQIKFSSMMVVVLGLNKFNKQCQTKLWNIKQNYGILIKPISSQSKFKFRLIITNIMQMTKVYNSSGILLFLSNFFIFS